MTPCPNAEFELKKLAFVARQADDAQSMFVHDAEAIGPRIIDLDASFAAGGTWAGVDRLAEAAYLSLLEIGQHSIVEQHRIELFAVLLKYRDRIAPKFPCLTDTASAAERTRFYPVDRAYRLIHGLVEMVMQWKRALGDQRSWVIVARNFDQAEHLGTRFFIELARRGANDSRIEVIVEARRGWADAAPGWPGTQIILAATNIALPPRPTTPRPISESEALQLRAKLTQGVNVSLEPEYLTLFAYDRSSGADLAAAQVAMNLLIIYNSYGYYHEAKSFLTTILPCFDALVGEDDGKRMDYVAKMNTGLVMTRDPDAALRVVGDMAAACLTRKRDLAHMNYLLAMHHLRYADVRDIELAEQYILRATHIVNSELDETDPIYDAFLRVFVANGVAFLRARQGRHQEALDLCRSGYEFLTNQLGEDRHRLHRSVLQYNIAQVYVMLGRLEEGLEHYHRALDMDPNYSEYYNEIGNILQKLERYEEAVAYYEQAIERSAPYPEVFFNKAICHFRREEMTEALKNFEISLELDPNQVEAHALRADVLRELGEYAAAIRGYDTAIAMGCGSVAVRVNRAALHYDYGAYEMALSDMDHVITVEGHVAEHYENRAAIYQAMQRHDLYGQDIIMAEYYREAA